MSARQPIDPQDIRAGDLIREESNHGRDAREYVAEFDREAKWAEDDRFFLLDRPKPAVELPSEPTLGWVETSRGRSSASIWSYKTGAWLNRGDATPNINRRDVTAFIPAVAVPKAALDELRIVIDHHHDDLSYDFSNDCVEVVDRFFAAVDKAGDQS